MLRSEAAKYARWSAGVALVLAALTVGVFMKRAAVRHEERKNAPPPAPVDVERLSTSINFSKVEQKQTIFTVAAAKSTEFKGEDANLLEDVRITIYGKDGKRHDTLHTKRCRFFKEQGDITCAGEVQMDLLSAGDFEYLKTHPEDAAGRTMRVITRGVTFRRSSGMAETDQAVSFRFPNGEGIAVGAEYDSEKGSLRLDGNVHITLRQAVLPAGKAAQSGQTVEVTGSELEFGRDSRLLKLKGPAEAQTKEARLTAGLFQMELDNGFRAKDLEALPGRLATRPEMTLHGPSGSETLSADSIRAEFSTLGWVKSLDASGKIEGNFLGKGRSGSLTAATAHVELWPRTGQPKEVELRGEVDVRLKGEKDEESRELRTEALRISFARPEEHESSHPLLAETLGAGSLRWTKTVASGRTRGATQTSLQAGKLALEFGSMGKARKLTASGTVRTERRLPGRSIQTATAEKGWVDLLAGGGWSQMGLKGNVRLKEGDRLGLADLALFANIPETATLRGHASVRDSATETSATEITLVQTSGDFTATGGVHSADFSAKSSSVNLAPAPANITANSLTGNEKSGYALYSGHARFWQGANVLEADTILLQRDARVLTAKENVRAVFLQERPGIREASARPKVPMLWHITAGKLTYWDKQDRAHLENNVILASPEERMRSDRLDLYFARAAGKEGSVAAGTQQISRAVAEGKVVVEQGMRRATAQRGEYTASEGKFVMSGGNPTIFDANSGTTTGSQLTFFLTDDTIVVDSKNGSRTVTKHRIEN